MLNLRAVAFLVHNISQKTFLSLLLWLLCVGAKAAFFFSWEGKLMGMKILQIFVCFFNDDDDVDYDDFGAVRLNTLTNGGRRRRQIVSVLKWISSF